MGLVKQECFKSTIYAAKSKLGKQTNIVRVPMCIYYKPETGCTLNGCIRNFQKGVRE